jgi:competence protein ComEA
MGPAESAGPPETAGLAEDTRRFSAPSGSNPFDPGRRGVKALAAVAALVVVAAGFLAWRSRPQSDPVTPAAPVSAAPGAPAAAGAPGAPAVAEQGGPSGTGRDEVVVAVAGKVRRPGLVRLPPGARVADAIEAAGGLLPGTDLATVNLARKVADGELIVVGVPAPAAFAGGGSAGPAGPAALGDKVNLNTATLAQLDTLPGVGPVLAQRILSYRTNHGGFRSVTDLRQVDGIGDSRFEQLKDLVTV